MNAPERARGRLASAAAAAAVAGVLGAVAVLASTLTGGPASAHPEQVWKPVNDLVVDVPEGWTLDEASQGCATEPFTVVVTDADIADCLTDAVTEQNSPVAYVTPHPYAAHSLVWAGGRLEFGSVLGVDGGVVVARAPRAKGTGEVLVRATSETVAQQAITALAPRYPSARATALAPPDALSARASFPTGTGLWVPGPRVEGEASRSLEATVTLLDALPEKAARCLAVEKFDGSRSSVLRPGVTYIAINEAPRSKPYEVFVGPADCPVVVDSWGAVAARPADLVDKVADVTLAGEPLIAQWFDQAWGVAGP